MFDTFYATVKPNVDVKSNDNMNQGLTNLLLAP